MKNIEKNSIVENFATMKIEKPIRKVIKLYDQYFPKDGKFDNYILSNIGYRLPIAQNCYLEMSNDVTDIIANSITLYVDNIPYINYKYKGIGNAISNVGNAVISGVTFGIGGEAPMHIVTKVPQMLTSQYLKNVTEGIKNALPNIEHNLKVCSKRIALFHDEMKSKNIKYSFKEYKKSDEIKEQCRKNRIILGIELYYRLHTNI